MDEWLNWVVGGIFFVAILVILALIANAIIIEPHTGSGCQRLEADWHMAGDNGLCQFRGGNIYDECDRHFEDIVCPGEE